MDPKQNDSQEYQPGAQGSEAVEARDGAVKGGRRPAAASLWYVVLSFALAAGGLGLIAEANRQYAPEMYKSGYMADVAKAFANGEAHTVFDLNINIRELRNEQIARLDKAPSLIVLGASQWQEAGSYLMPNRGYLNAHVHRDYYEDVLGVSEMLVQHNKLPRDLVITIRDRMFTPVGKRTDFLWLPIIPYYQAMAKRLELDQHKFWELYPLQRPREMLSLGMLFKNAVRWHNASDTPYPTLRDSHRDMDVLLPDGSIRWSDDHMAAFTPARARRLAFAHADASANHPPEIDPQGVAALDALLNFMTVRGVKVRLAHPPFNPLFYDRVKGTPYMEGLRRVEKVAHDLAVKHKLSLVGSFDPAELGCTADMFIDAEHSNENCLSLLLADIANDLDLPKVPMASIDDVSEMRRQLRTRKALMSSGWMLTESALHSGVFRGFDPRPADSPGPAAAAAALEQTAHVAAQEMR